MGAKQMKPQIVCMLMELRSTLFLPYILAFKLPAKARDIIDRIDRGTVSAPSFSTNPRDPGIGDVCRPALFLYEDRSRAEELSKSLSACNDKIPEAERKMGNARNRLHFHSRNAKIEKSLLNFRTQHPTWAAIAPSTSSVHAHAGANNQNPISASHTGDDLVAALAEFQDRQVGGIRRSEHLQEHMDADTAQSSMNQTLRKMAKDLSTSRILADSHISSSDASRRNVDEEGGSLSPLIQRSLTLGRSSSNFFSTNHMVELPVDHPSVSGIYPSAEPLFFWLDK